MASVRKLSESLPAGPASFPYVRKLSDFGRSPSRRGLTNPGDEEVIYTAEVEKLSLHVKAWRKRRLWLQPSGLLWGVASQDSTETTGALFFVKETFKGCVASTGSAGSYQSGAGFTVSTEERQYHFRCKHAGEAEQWITRITEVADVTAKKVEEQLWSYVFLNVYHVSHLQSLRALNFVTKDVFFAGGVFHGGVEVYGEEYSFGGLPPGEDSDRSGVGMFRPRQCPEHTFLSAQCLGLCTKSQVDVLRIVRTMCPEWQAKQYRLLDRNCVSFSRELAGRICPTAARTFPDWVDSFARAGARVKAVRARPKPAGQLSTASSAERLKADGFSSEGPSAEVPLDAVVLHMGEAEVQTRHLGRWRNVIVTVRLRSLEFAPPDDRSAWFPKSRGLSGRLVLDPTTFLEARPADIKDGYHGLEIACTGQTLQFRCQSAADARRWSSIVAAVVRTAEAVPNSTESFLVKRVRLASTDESYGSEPGSGVAVDVRCLQGHSCSLHTPSLFGRGRGQIKCSRCSRALAAKEALWRCEPCNFDLCRLCSAEHMVY